jgi:hypothetical protein
MHRHRDPLPPDLDDAAVRAAATELIVNAFDVPRRPRRRTKE